MILSESGVFSGIPRSAGAFNFSVVASSGSQASTVQVLFQVVEPELQFDDVFAELLGRADRLNGDERRYLDFIGNRNDLFDLGDFAAWLSRTGLQLTRAQRSRANRVMGKNR